MRTDVKVGLVCSLVVVVLAGWYFVERDGSEPDLSVSQSDTLVSLRDSGEPRDDTPASSGPEVTPVAPTSPQPVPSEETRLADRRAPTEPGTSLEGLLAGGDGSSGPFPGSGEAEPDRQAAGSEMTAGGPAGGSADFSARGLNSAGRPPTAETHTVRAGQTLAELARMYYGDARLATVLAEANPQIDDPTELVIGTRLRIPDRDEAVSAPGDRRSFGAAPVDAPAGRTYVVLDSDSLYKIAREQLAAGSRWEEIYSLNKQLIGDDPDHLKPGMILTLPPK